MNLKVNNIIQKLQKERKLPPGIAKFETWQQQFSIVTRVNIDSNIYFFKWLTPRNEHSIDDLERKLCSEFNALVKIQSYLQNDSRFSIPEPIYYSKEELLIVTKEVKGIPLEVVGNQYARRFKPVDNNSLSIFKRTGSFLSNFHQYESFGYSIDDLDDLIKYISNRLISRGLYGKLDENLIILFLERKRHEIIRKIDRYKKNPVHHDFNPTNILSDGECINILDFGDFKIDHIYQDLIYFKLMIDGQLGSVLKYRQDRRIDLINAFYDGYGFTLNEHKSDGLYQLYMLKNLSVFLITMSERKKLPIDFKLSLKSVIMLKDRIVNYLDYKRTRSEILQIVSGT